MRFVRDVEPNQSLLAAALDLHVNEGGGTVRLTAAGDYFISRTSWPDTVSLVGQGLFRTRVIVTDLGTPEAADDPNNAGVMVRASRSPGVMDTSLAPGMHVFTGDCSLRVASAGSLDPAAQPWWIEINGRNVGVDEYAFSPPPPTAESIPVGATMCCCEVRRVVLRVDNSDGTSTLYVDAPFKNFHSSSPNVRVVALSSSSRELVFADFTIEGVRPGFDQTIASGIVVSGAEKIHVERVGGRGFSRAIVEFRDGARCWQLRRLYNFGEVNSPFIVDAAHDGMICDIDDAPDGLRCHTRGKPMGWVIRNRPADVHIIDSIRRHGVIGSIIYGGQRIKVRNVRIEDMDGAEALVRLDGGYPDGTKEMWGGLFGVGWWEGGSAVPVRGEYPDIDVDDLTINNCKLPTTRTNGTPAAAFAAYFADGRGERRNVRISHTGRVETPDLYQGRGPVCLNDFAGVFDRLVIRGFRAGIETMTQGPLGGVRVRRVTYEPNAGAPLAGQCALNLTSDAGPNHPVLFEDWIVGNLFSTPIRVAQNHSPYTPTFTHYRYRFLNVRLDPWGAFDELVPILTPTSCSFTAGTIVEDDPAAPTGVRLVQLSTGTGQQYRVANTMSPVAGRALVQFAEPL